MCRPLPPEMWAEICSHIDDSTLWIVCRQVSTVLRAEAEREFATSRLPFLKMYCEYSEVDSNVFIALREYEGLSEDGKRVKFSLSIGIHGGYDESVYKSVRDTVPKVLQCKDLEFCRGIGQDSLDEKRLSIWTRFCFHGSHVKDLGIPALEVDSQTEPSSSGWDVFVSFDWKAFFNAFYHN